jgi:hypothetical protein
MSVSIFNRESASQADRIDRESVVGGGTGGKDPPGCKKQRQEHAVFKLWEMSKLRDERMWLKASGAITLSAY